MKFLTLPSFAAALLAVTGGPASAQPPALKDGYVKVHVEVESRGVLKVTAKDATLYTRFTSYDQRDDKKELPAAEGAPPHPIELDFARHPELRELAKALDGKEVVLTGLSELRYVPPPPAQPGGFSGFGPGGSFGYPPYGPTWRLHQTVLVTGLKSAPGKR